MCIRDRHADEVMLCEIIKQNTFDNTVWIIAPHNVNAKHIQRLQNMLEGKGVLLSGLTITSSPVSPPEGEKQPSLSSAIGMPNNGDSINDIAEKNVLIVDSIGMLSSIYAYANVAYIGGGFGASVHNVLEAAVYGVGVLFGSNYKKSMECVDLKREQGGFSISNKLELREKISMMLEPSRAVKTGEISRNYVMNRAGGTDKIFTFVQQYLIG